MLKRLETPEIPKAQPITHILRHRVIMYMHPDGRGQGNLLTMRGHTEEGGAFIQNTGAMTEINADWPDVPEEVAEAVDVLAGFIEARTEQVNREAREAQAAEIARKEKEIQERQKALDADKNNLNKNK